MYEHPAPPPVKLAVIVPVPVADGPEKIRLDGVRLTGADCAPVPFALVAATCTNTSCRWRVRSP
jgi:hypothetical protein